MSACRRWNEKPAAEKTWTYFKSHFAAAHRQHKQMQGETAANAGYHSASASMTQNEDQMDDATIGALANLATSTAADRGVVADKLLPLPQPPVRARTDARTNPSAQRATQLRSVLARVYAVSAQNQITTSVP
jgi:hypothetical protein